MERSGKGLDTQMTVQESEEQDSIPTVERYGVSVATPPINSQEQRSGKTLGHSVNANAFESRRRRIDRSRRRRKDYENKRKQNTTAGGRNLVDAIVIFTNTGLLFSAIILFTTKPTSCNKSDPEEDSSFSTPLNQVHLQQSVPYSPSTDQGNLYQEPSFPSSNNQENSDKDVSSSPPDDQEYSNWSHWSRCPVSCGGGKQERTRTCITGSCSETLREVQPCGEEECTEYSDWSIWSRCPVSCSGGDQKRTRTCISGACTGTLQEVQPCGEKECTSTSDKVVSSSPPDIEEYSNWSIWSICPVTCGGGEQERTRTCIRGSCTETLREVQPCGEEGCTEYSDWSDWSTCPVTCGGGEQEKTRTCIRGACTETLREVQPCGEEECPLSLTVYDDISNATHPCGVSDVKPDLLKGRIVGGAEAVPNSWPFTVGLGITKVVSGGLSVAQNCGATLVSSRNALTAAHCFLQDKDLKQTYTVFASFHDQTTYAGLTLMEVAVVRIHPKTNVFETNHSLVYDFALLTLLKEFNPSRNIQIACLPEIRKELPEGTLCWATGWGDTKGTGSDRLLKQVLLDIVSEARCRKEFIPDIETKSTICAGTTLGQDTCQGDSGGPLYHQEKGKWVVYGVTSYGNECGEGPMAAYGTVSYQMEWLCCYMSNLPACNGIQCVPSGRN